MNKLLATILTAAVLASASSAVMAQDTGAQDTSAQDTGVISTPYDGRATEQPFAHPGLAKLAAQARHPQHQQVQPSNGFDSNGYSPRVDIQ
jgi:hypothetical protein